MAAEGEGEVAEVAQEVQAEVAPPPPAANTGLAGPLFRAITRLGVKEVIALVEKGGPLLHPFELDLNDKDLGIGTALDLAVMHKRYDLGLRLLRLGTPDSERLPLESSRAVAWSARDGKLELLQALLQAGAPPGQLDEASRSALLLAAQRGHGECARVLLAAGAWEAESQKDEVATWAAHFRLGPALGEAAPDVLAAAGRPVDGGEARALAPAPPARPPTEQEVAAAAAALHIRLEFALTRLGVKEVKALIEQGAPLTSDYDLDATGKAVGNPLDLALVHRRFELAAQLLAMHGEKLALTSTRAVAVAARDGRTALLKELLRLGADATQCDEKGQSALLLAALRGQADCVRALLDAGAFEAEPEPDLVRGSLEKWKLPFALA